MKIAIVGTGISGLTAIHYLSKNHEVDAYEAKSHPGGHANTIDIMDEGNPLALDTGFIVFNDRTYPNFIRLLNELGVKYQPSSMSFGIKHEPSGLEYRGADWGGLFAQRRRILSPRHLRLLYEIYRFNKTAGRLRKNLSHEMTIREFFAENQFRSDLLEYFFLPMGAAIWSTSCDNFLGYPIRFVLDFYFHHGLLNIRDRPQWFTVSEGSRTYVNALIQEASAQFFMDTPVTAIKRRQEGGAELILPKGEKIGYDHVIIATHSNQALKLVANPTSLEREILETFRYEPNIATVHTDSSILPKNQRAWASWNYLLEKNVQPKASVTYWMNRLQSLDATQPYLVTLNAQHRIDPTKIIQTIEYHHPQFDERTFRASGRHNELINHDGISYCGAYWGAGFHEDGVRSSLKVVNQLFPDCNLSVLGEGYA
ncbi:MAG: FAD-dependent oxidoreductase [Planctomycetota bacterium]|nr:FAD-dependent oxidoreductase [Planctomycetota bacterium]